jgi:uncharacterized protein YlxP (DUF503 family)
VGFSCVGNEKGFVNAVMDKVIDFIEKTPTVDIIDYKIEIL